MLSAIDLSLSSLCGADCIYCPISCKGVGEGKRDRGKWFMSLETVKQIIDEIASPTFKAEHRITSISLGENGDAFLNKKFISIARYIKAKVSHVNVVLFTNFQHFTKEKAEIIIQEGLVDAFATNIDGASDANYRSVKRMDYGRVRKNVADFLDARERLNSDVTLSVNVLTLHNYIHTVKRQFGFYPAKLDSDELADVPDDYEQTRMQMERILDLEKDTISKPNIIAWAEREQVDKSEIEYDSFSCPLLKRVETEAFIAPDGTWYACCFDHRNVLRFGNVIEGSIGEVYASDERRQFIRKLKERRFAEIGPPCDTVNTCQPIFQSKASFAKRKLKTFIKSAKCFAGIRRRCSPNCDKRVNA